MKEINVAIIGSGSTYCPELIDGFLKAQDSLKLKRIARKLRKVMVLDVLRTLERFPRIHQHGGCGRRDYGNR